MRPSPTSDEAAELLNEHTVAPYLVTRGVIDADQAAVVVPLGGGVSNIVLQVRAGSVDVVVKQALPQLRVPERWAAKQERTVAEAAALHVARELTPQSVPNVTDRDPEACVVVIESAPPGWKDWKTSLLAGDTDLHVAAAVGDVLARWHASTHTDATLSHRFADLQAFDELRLDPYYRYTATRLPHHRDDLLRLTDELQRHRCCLVHGDFSPKNVLVGSDGLWVIDFEVAHYGDPAFDLAFMTTHLLMKAIHRPGARPEYRRCCEAFWDAYRASMAGSPSGPGVAEQHVVGHVGALLLARVYGKSPAEYLTPPQQEVAASLGETLLANPPGRTTEVWVKLKTHT